MLYRNSIKLVIVPENIGCSVNTSQELNVKYEIIYLDNI